MAEMEAAIQRLWARLPQVGAFSFTASNSEGSATDWNGRGEGRVQVTDHQGRWLFNEQGRYITPHGKELAMHNRFWWQRSERGDPSLPSALSSAGRTIRAAATRRWPLADRRAPSVRGGSLQCRVDRDRRRFLVELADHRAAQERATQLSLSGLTPAGRHKKNRRRAPVAGDKSEVF